MIKSTSVLKP